MAKKTKEEVRPTIADMHLIKDDFEMDGIAITFNDATPEFMAKLLLDITMLVEKEHSYITFLPVLYPDYTPKEKSYTIPRL